MLVISLVVAISLFACETPEVANEEETITISVTGMEEDLLLGLDIDAIDYDPETRGAYQSSRQMTFTPASRSAQSKMNFVNTSPAPMSERRMAAYGSVGHQVMRYAPVRDLEPTSRQWINDREFVIHFPDGSGMIVLIYDDEGRLMGARFYKKDSKGNYKLVYDSTK